MVEDHSLVLPRFGSGSVDHANVLESNYRSVYGDKGLDAWSKTALGRERDYQERTNGKLRFHVSDYRTGWYLPGAHSVPDPAIRPRASVAA
jgi:hypothetical protein